MVATKKFSDELRRVLRMYVARKDTPSIRKLQDLIGVPNMTLYRFLYGDLGLSMAVIDRLLEFIGADVLFKFPSPLPEVPQYDTGTIECDFCGIHRDKDVEDCPLCTLAAEYAPDEDED